MTREILHSDIIFAQRLLAAGCEQSGIATRLTLRGLERQKALLLVQRLQQGEPVAPELALAPCTLRRHRSGYRRCHSRHGHHGRNHQHRLREAPLALPILSQHRPGRRHHLKWYFSRAFVAGIGTLGLVCLGYVLYVAFKAFPTQPNDEYEHYLNRAVLHEQGLHVPPSDNLKKLPGSP